MKYDITHTCGHAGRTELFGKTSERERRISYLETTLCPECYATAQATKAGGEWIEMPYSQYKNSHADCPKRNYNAATKTIMVLVPAEDTTEDTTAQIIAELKAINVPDDHIDYALKVSSADVQKKLDQYLADYPEAVNAEKESYDLATATIGILKAHGR